MTTFTPRLGLPFLEAAQAQKHVTHNAALERLDVITQMTVQAMDGVTPPTSPVEGQIWALGDSPTGAWAGQAGNLAAWSGGGWLFVTPRAGWRVWDLAGSTLHVRTGAGAWTALAGDLAPAPAPQLDNLPRLGLNATADVNNRLTVSANATLLSHAGAGHQVKVNKAATANTGSLLFQTGFSGRAEMGLTGNDDFSVKVSADGSDWKQGLRVEGATGLTLARGLMSQRVVLADDTAVTIQPPSNGGFVLVLVVDEMVTLATHAAIFVYDTGPTPVLMTVFAASNFANGMTTPLTGTTGVDTRSTMSAQDGQLMLENRSGTARTYSLTFLGGV